MNDLDAQIVVKLVVIERLFMDSPSPPKRIGAYDVVGVIGRGGMGTVYKATDPRIGRAVAIKVLTLATEDPDLLLLRFYREAKYTGNLQHPNIVTVHELGYQDGSPYLVMEYLEGVSLATLISEHRPMPVAEKLRIIMQICSGLAYAHKRELVHRDIKPANVVIVENNTAKIVDFGIASVGGRRVTQTGRIMGSLSYMSPEQLNGDVELDARTDIYSTGVVMFELLSGVLPFDGGTAASTLTKIIQEPTPSITRYMKDCPPELEAVLNKALAKDREERYASAEDFAFDLARVHDQFGKQMLADYLREAAELLERKDYSSARQQVLQVLRMAPQNAEAGDLLLSIKHRQEKEQKSQQAVQLQAKAEEAFRRNAFDDALQYVEQGLQFELGNPVLLRLRDGIAAAQEKMASYREALQRAESALQSGDLENARASVDRAGEIFPDDPQHRRIAGQIQSRIDQRAREEEAARREKKLALDIGIVEKAMEDARAQLSVGHFKEAVQLLEGTKGLLSQLPPKWAEQVDILKREVRGQQDQAAREKTEREQRARQLSQLQSKAEEAFRRNSFDDALQYVEQGLQFDPNAAVLIRLRDSVASAQKRMARYREALQRAEFALQSGDLENARMSVDRAIEIFPEDPQGKRVASQIRSRMEQRAREQEAAARREKQLALDVAVVEKAFEDARVRLSLGQIPEAVQLLQGIEPRVSQLPPKWGEELEQLRAEVWTRQNQAVAPPPPPSIHDDPANNWKTATSFGPLPKIGPDLPAPPPRGFEEGSAARFPQEAKVDFVPKPVRTPDLPTFRVEERPGIGADRLPAPQPTAKPWTRSTVWLGFAVVILAVALLYLILRPHRRTGAPLPPPSYTYAEINAEPWGTVKEITPANGEAHSVIGLTTPLQVKLPAGEYRITLEGPSHELKQVAITVPQEGGAIGFILFAKPDLNQILNRP